MITIIAIIIYTFHGPIYLGRWASETLTIRNEATKDWYFNPGVPKVFE